MIGLLGAPTAKLVSESDLSMWSGPRVAFYLAALVVVGGALFTITRRNTIGAVMSLVGTFFGLAACYALLSAHFLAALQVLVYAGAIMVLFIFVVMVLNRDEIEPWVWRGLPTKLLFGVGPMLYLTYKLIYYLGLAVPARSGEPPEEFGTIAEVGQILFTDYLFAFEAVSILLLIAVIAAVVVARTHKQSEDAVAAATHDAAATSTVERAHP